ncbi:hypothetical protein K7432_005740 [Basidiobolus ranarum]|uniref:Uncharacterized protein n=1 Tax=Basidiobolus ranarum TaxID=34480 RepID=A0ABR2W3K0_9FUNG
MFSTNQVEAALLFVLCIALLRIVKKTITIPWVKRPRGIFDVPSMVETGGGGGEEFLELDRSLVSASNFAADLLIQSSSSLPNISAVLGLSSGKLADRSVCQWVGFILTGSMFLKPPVYEYWGGK